MVAVLLPLLFHPRVSNTAPMLFVLPLMKGRDCGGRHRGPFSGRHLVPILVVIVVVVC